MNRSLHTREAFRGSSGKAMAVALVTLLALVLTFLLEFFVFNFGRFRGGRLEEFPEDMKVSYTDITVDKDGFLTPTDDVTFIEYELPEEYYIYKFTFRVETDSKLPIHYEIVLDDKRQVRDMVNNAEILDETDTVYVNALTDELSFAINGAEGTKFKLEFLDLVYDFKLNPIRMACIFISLMAIAYTVACCFRVFKLRLDNIFVVYALIFGLPLIWLVPPRYTWDEFSHLTRVVYLVNGDIKLEEDTISEFPYDYYGIKLRDYRSYEDFMVYLDSFNGEKGTAYNHLQTSAVTYVPIVYSIPAIGVFIAKLFNLSALYYVYLPRMACLIFYAIMVKLAILKMPSNKLLFFFLALIPNTLFLSCGVNISAVQNGCIFYAMASLCYEIEQCKTHKDWSISTGSYLIMLVCLLVVVMCRVTYAFFVLLLWLLPRERIKNRFLRRFNYPFVFLVFTGITLFVLYYSTLIGGITTYGLEDVHPKEQLALVLYHPFRYIGRVVDHIANYLLTNRVGLDLVNTDYNGHLNGFIALTITMVLTIVTFAGDPRKLAFDNAWARILIFSVAFMSLIGTITAMYLYYNVYNSLSIEGVQPRYVISLLPVFLPAVQSENFYLIRKGRGFIYGLMFYVVFCYIDFFRILIVHFYA